MRASGSRKLGKQGRRRLCRMYDYGSPENRRINGRQSNNRTIWNNEPWKFRRLLFLSTAQGGCVWCGNPPKVVCHPPGSPTYGTEDYLDFRKAKCYPLCVSCARAEYRGQVLCPRCRRTGHYCAPGNVCWDCIPEAERERLLYLRDKRKRDRSQYARTRARSFRPKKVIDNRTGKWITISPKQNSSTSSRS